MAVVVLYDACVLDPAPLRDLLLRIAQTGVVHACWTEEILEECFRNIQRARPELSTRQLSRTCKLMNRALPDCLVTGYEFLVNALRLPDPNDRHVLAAAVHAHARYLVTFNLRDFPESALAPWDLEARHPDDFVLELLELAPVAVLSAVGAQRAALKNPPRTLGQLLGTLAAQGLAQAVARLRQLLGPEALG